MAANESLKAVYADEIKDLWSANDQMSKVVKVMSEKAHDPKLKQALEKSQSGIKSHTDTLKSLLTDTEEEVESEHCKGMEGLVKEATKHITQEAPHSTALEAQAFVVKSINTYAQAHPDVVAGEIRNWTPDPLLPGQVRMPAPKTTAEWIDYQVTRSEIILWREKCGLCHRDLNRTGDTTTQAVLMPASFTPGSGLPTAMPSAVSELAATPEIEPAKQQIHWYRAAVFSHPAHQAVECIECHGGALTSVSNADILMPSIATCRKCHDGESSPQGPPVKTGHAESGCFLCHVYHGDQTGELTSKHNVAQLTSR